jgi:hypothetical protein
MLVHKGVFPRIDCNCMQEKKRVQRLGVPSATPRALFYVKNVQVGVPRRLFFAAQQRIAVRHVTGMVRIT